MDHSASVGSLSFLCKVFRKKLVPVRLLPASQLPEAMASFFSDGIGDARFAEGGSGFLFLSKPQDGTLYQMTDSFYRVFYHLLLPNSENALFIGPFLREALPEEEILLLGERMRLSPRGIAPLKEYYTSLPIVSADDSLMLLLESFCEEVWKTRSFEICSLGREESFFDPPFATEAVSDTAVSVKAMELRYAFEDELMRAVSMGQEVLEERFLGAFSAEVFEKRAATALRNGKNYCIIMNTLLRKAAQKGGVHPVYLDQISSDFAHRIESLPATRAVSELMREMYRSYCRLVQRFAVREHSDAVTRTILAATADLTADLSPASLAARLGLSPGYLSTLFRKETGMTLSAFVREKRMEKACRLLSTTGLQIQSIAQHCGILDIQYFTKLFKKQYGLTPTAFRKREKRRSAERMEDAAAMD